MSDIFLKQRLREICRSGATLLWLEGTNHETVHSVKLSHNRLILQLESNVTRVIRFDRYATTRVGLQFWTKGHPGVLYKWEQVPAGTHSPGTVTAGLLQLGSGLLPDDEPPPNQAA